MNDVEKLLALEEIRSLKARYWRLLDTKDWESLVEVFSDDARMDMSGAGTVGGGAVGKRQVVDFIRSRVGDVLTVHHGHTPEIELHSDTTASGIWPMTDRLRWPEGSSLNGVVELTGLGHYHDEYVRVSEGWKISSTAVTRLRVDVVRRAGNGPPS